MIFWLAAVLNGVMGGFRIRMSGHDRKKQAGSGPVPAGRDPDDTGRAKCHQHLEVKIENEILKCLKETDGYVSGQELCERLGVSRTAVWKVIRQLEAEGYEIEAVRNRGYRFT